MVSSGTTFPGTQAMRVIIDTDSGIDDAAAILMALGSPELQV
jgi:inosine-uridine nucleoside N-ribohydrolase